MSPADTHCPSGEVDLILISIGQHENMGHQMTYILENMQ